MILREEVVKSSEQRAPKLRPAAGAETASFESITPPLTVKIKAAERRVLTADALARRVSNISFAGAHPSSTELERMIGTNDLVDEFYLERALVAAKPVCRLVLRNASGHERGYATGFMVSPRLALTNWHVFPTKSEAANALAQFDYKLDIRGAPAPSYRFALRPHLFHYANRALDYCLVAVAPTSIDQDVPLSQFGYHSLSSDPAKIEEGEWITIIQHPGGQWRQFAIRENQLVDMMDQFLWYYSDTAQGSSGSPAFNDSFQVVALHHSGKAKRQDSKYVLKNGQLVDSIEGIDDSLINWEANEGLRISQLCEDMKQNLPSGDFTSELFDSMQTGGIMARSLGEELAPMPERKTASDVALALPQGLVVPLRIQVSLGIEGTRTTVPPARQEPVTKPGAAVDATTGAALEKMVAPPIDPDYDNREGYDHEFLETSIPLPQVADETSVAAMDNGTYEIPYEHFSVVMHKKRRLALFTASNVSGNPTLRKPEPGDYTRKALTGLGPNDREQWVTDPRIPAKYQVPDDFYNKDGGAFDKGHIVRREDVCWGTSRDQIVKANCDTFHTTNCSPQVADFNQSGKGGIWGQLENEVLKQVKGYAYSLFAGPVLGDDDRIFNGKGKHGPLKLQIPSRYWKVVVTRDNGALQAFAFVLEQDLRNVPLERFEPDENWVAYSISIDDLEAELGNTFAFPEVVKKADQHGKDPGDELMKRAEIQRFEVKASRK